jgi:DeoR family transcriptional regulator, fructose operon transcriptional repressor
VVRRTIIAHTAASYVLADSSKLGVIAVHRVCPLEAITAVITDGEQNPRARAELAAGVRLLCADTGHPSLTEAG